MMRRSRVIKNPNAVACPNCGAAMMPGQTCKRCTTDGTSGGVIKIVTGQQPATSGEAATEGTVLPVVSVAGPIVIHGLQPAIDRARAGLPVFSTTVRDAQLDSIESSFDASGPKHTTLADGQLAELRPEWPAHDDAVPTLTLGRPDGSVLAVLHLPANWLEGAQYGGPIDLAELNRLELFEPFGLPEIEMLALQLRLGFPGAVVDVCRNHAGGPVWVDVRPPGQSKILRPIEVKTR